MKPHNGQGPNNVVNQGAFKIGLIDREYILQLMTEKTIENSQWVLKPARDKHDKIITGDEHEGHFNIQLNYGEVQPRIVKRKSFRSYQILATMDTIDGYDDPKNSKWTIRVRRKGDIYNNM